MKRLSTVAALLMALLTACPGGGSPGPTPPSSVFTAENAWKGPIPEGTEALEQVEFERRLKAGELVLVTDKTQELQRSAALAQVARDVATLEGIPTEQRSASVNFLLQQASQPGNPLAEPEFQFKPGASGKTGTATLLSVASSLRQAVQALETARDPQNALAAYRSSFETAPAEAVAGLRTPEQVQGKPLAEIQAAQATLEAALSRLETDLARPESEIAQALSPQSVVIISDTPPKAGKGTDGEACGTGGAGGIRRNFWWPLKRFVTPARDQGRRGTCWAFAGVAALESRERVVNGEQVNLSEQFLVQRSKLIWSEEHLWDGGSPWFMLEKASTTQTPIALESHWTYNPAWGRPDNAFSNDDPKTPALEPQIEGTPASYVGACKDYSPDGSCSETAHQSPMACVQVFGGTYCGYAAPRGSASGIQANPLIGVWNAADQSFPLATVRNHLSNGRALVARLDVNASFSPNAEGFLTDLTPEVGGGGHFVLVVGYISNTLLKQRLPNAPQAAGGGYFLIKNSWGCWGDGGYGYVPVNYLKKYFTDLSVLDMPSTRSAAWQSEVMNKPTVKISAPTPAQKLEAKVPHTFKASVTRFDPFTVLDCTVLIWRTDLVADGIKSGCTPTFTFSSAGERRVRASYPAGGQDAYDEVPVLVEANKSGPTVRLTAPISLEGSGIATVYVDFSKPLTFEATASDLQDGPNCCSSGFIWYSQKKGVIGKGQKLTVSMVGTESDYVGVNVTDSDGNVTSSAVFWLRDATPILTILTPPSPLEGQNLILGKPYTFAVDLQAFATSDVTYDCSSVVWKTNLVADGILGTQTGCSVQFTFSSAGERTITASFSSAGRVASVAVRKVTVSANTAPSAIITSPPVRGGVPTFQDNEPISLGGSVGDRESDTVVYQWILVLNPGGRGESRQEITPATFISGALSVDGKATRELPSTTFKLSSFGAVCEPTERQYALELKVTDAGPLESTARSTTVSRTIAKGSCKP